MRTLLRGFVTALWTIFGITTLPQAGAQQTSNANPQPIVAMNSTVELEQRLLTAYQALPENYSPRTEHLLEDGTPMFINRLVEENSPYLLQHAHNPVNWYPWGEEAFAMAKAQDKPVFLSIGYATCHWCHVMERESFEDIEIASLMNDNFISIKVDREQLPDVDALFMSAVMMINGSGGWPMSSFLDPDGRIFYGGTYFAPDQFTVLLTRIDQLWKEQREPVLKQASTLAAELELINDVSVAAATVGKNEISRGVFLALDDFDADNGGFGQAPKFPRESTLFFLLDQAARGASSQALNAAHITLERMAAGGIHDQVGGGFHRYSVDSSWRVPHFEKMLYNQAALGRNYAQAFALTGDVQHERTARRILQYVLRDMTSEDGLFYSAIDADSEGEEGRFFVWTPEQLTQVLGDEEAALAQQVWNINGQGNFEGYSIMHTTQPHEQLAKTLDLSNTQLQLKINSWSEQLRIAREQREHPLRDEKIIASWNGMMISALIDGANYLNEPEFKRAAIRAGNALWDRLHVGKGRLHRSYFNGGSSIDGTQADYAYVAEGYIALHDATGEPRWLQLAERLVDTMNAQFWDEKDGAYFMGSRIVSGAKLAARPKDLADNAIASGNSVALRVLAKLFRRTGEEDLRTRADELVAALSSKIARQPAGFYYLLTALNEHLDTEIGAIQHAARGTLFAKASVDNDKFRINIRLRKGWHINSTHPLQDYLIPTKLSNSDNSSMSNVHYPDAIIRRLGFQRSELSLFEGNFSVLADLPDAVPLFSDVQPTNHVSASVYRATLQVQACNDSLCLAPETMTFQLPAH